MVDTIVVGVLIRELPYSMMAVGIHKAEPCLLFKWMKS